MRIMAGFSVLKDMSTERGPMETRQITLLKKPCAGLSLQTLKIIAIVAMTIDHAATAFVPEVPISQPIKMDVLI